MNVIDVAWARQCLCSLPYRLVESSGRVSEETSELPPVGHKNSKLNLLLISAPRRSCILRLTSHEYLYFQPTAHVLFVMTNGVI